MKNAPLIIICALAFAALTIVMGRGLVDMAGGWASLKPVWPYIAGGMAVVGALAGGLMWLAFYSSRRGYDEPYDVDKPPRL